jgi:hypothetical protein
MPGLGGTIGHAGGNFLDGLFGGKGGRSNAVGVAMAGRTQSSQVNHSIEAGVEQVATISVAEDAPAGTILYQALIAAPDLGVRLAAFAKLWTQTAFLGFVVEVTSSNPSSVSGNYTVAIDPDPAQTYVSGPGLPGRLMALTMAKKANAWADNSVTMKPNTIPLFNRFNLQGASDAEIREYAAGQIIIATTTAYAEACTYTVNIHWHVCFARPDTTQLAGVPNPSSYIISCVGYNAIVDGDSIPQRFIFPGSSAIWNVKPPVGTYSVLGLTMTFEDPTQTSIAVNVASIEVLVDGSTIIRSRAGSGLTAGTSRCIVQNPANFTLQGLGRSSTVGGPFNEQLVEAGFAKLHPWFPTQSHIEWHRNAKIQQEKAQRSQAVKQAITQRYIKALQNAPLSTLRLWDADDSASTLSEMVEGIRIAEESSDLSPDLETHS